MGDSKHWEQNRIDQPRVRSMCGGRWQIIGAAQERLEVGVAYDTRKEAEKALNRYLKIKRLMHWWLYTRPPLKTGRIGP